MCPSLPSLYWFSFSMTHACIAFPSNSVLFSLNCCILSCIRLNSLLAYASKKAVFKKGLCKCSQNHAQIVMQESARCHFWNRRVSIKQLYCHENTSYVLPLPRTGCFLWFPLRYFFRMNMLCLYFSSHLLGNKRHDTMVHSWLQCIRIKRNLLCMPSDHGHTVQINASLIMNSKRWSTLYLTFFLAQVKVNKPCVLIVLLLSRCIILGGLTDECEHSIWTNA